MKLDQNIQDAIKATIIIVVIVILIAAGIGIYHAVNNPESEEVYGFITFALILHADLDENEVTNDIFNLIDDISNAQVNNSQEITSMIDRESSIIRHYKERFYILISPTDEMRTLKESLIEEGTLLLVSYSFLREALENKINNDDNTYSLNMENAIQYLDEAMNLRIQNGIELEQWKMKIEEELSN